MDTIKNTDVGFYIKKLDNHIQRHMHSLYNRRELKECSLMNMRVVDFLFEQGERDTFQKDIEQEFFINRATTSKMLTLMEEKALLRRTSSPEDARLKKVELTPLGIELHERYKIIRREMEEKLTASLSNEEIELFKALCRRMIDGME